MAVVAGYADGMLLYIYAMNNPMVFVDPLGLQTECPNGYWTNFWDGLGGLFSGLGLDPWTSQVDANIQTQAGNAAEQLAEGKISPPEYAERLALLEKEAGEVQESVVDFEQARIDFAVGVPATALAPITGGASLYVSAAVELGNATVDVAQGQYLAGGLRVAGTAAGAGAGKAFEITAAKLATGAAARGGAQSAANAVRLNRQLASQEIAGGHAFGKHAGEFADLGITTRQQFAGHIENIMNNPSAFRGLRNGRSAFWDDATGTVVIRSPSAVDGGTAFRPTNGRAYFEGLR